MKKFLKFLKRELSILGLIPTDFSSKPKKFNLLKCQIDSRTLRNLYEKWADPDLQEILNKNQKEIIHRLRQLGKSSKFSSPTSSLSKRRSIDTQNTPSFDNGKVQASIKTGKQAGTNKSKK